MASNFSFDKRGFDKMVKEAVKEAAKETQKILDRLLRDYTGKPVPVVKAALKRAWPRDGRISDTEATEWATLISQGQRIVLQVKP